MNGLFADLLHVVQEYREGNERTALMEFGALRDEITRLIQIIQAGRPPADGSFVPPWGTVPPDSGYLPPIMPPAPFIPDSAELIERLGELDAAIDSARAELPTDVPVVVDLLDHADALADSARALLTAGQPFVAALRLAEAHGAIWARAVRGQRWRTSCLRRSQRHGILRRASASCWRPTRSPRRKRRWTRHSTCWTRPPSP